MSLDSSEMEWAVRLSGQLKTLSEVAESLTYRMLELEERFSGQQRHLTSRHLAAEQRHSDLADAMEARMRETENRLGHLEDLLRHVERRPVSPPPLRAVPQPSAAHPQGRPPSPGPLGEEQGCDSEPGEIRLDENFPAAGDAFDHSLAS
jgi:hypothetical protein